MVRKFRVPLEIDFEGVTTFRPFPQSESSNGRPPWHFQLLSSSSPIWVSSDWRYSTSLKSWLVHWSSLRWLLPVHSSQESLQVRCNDQWEDCLQCHSKQRRCHWELATTKMLIRCQPSTGLYLLCELHFFCRPRRKASSITWKHDDEVRLSSWLIVAIWSAIWVNCTLLLFSIWPIDAQKRWKCSGDEKSFQSLAMMDIFADASVVIAGWVSFSEQ